MSRLSHSGWPRLLRILTAVSAKSSLSSERVYTLKDGQEPPKWLSLAKQAKKPSS